jgi:hypothetical protein
MGGRAEAGGTTETRTRAMKRGGLPGYVAFGLKRDLVGSEVHMRSSVRKDGRHRMTSSNGGQRFGRRTEIALAWSCYTASPLQRRGK